MAQRMEGRAIPRQRTAGEIARTMLNKVPEVTIFFWLIKVLCTTVGETAADFLNENLGLGLTGTSIVMAVLLGIALVYQFRSNRYIPIIYWVSVMLISVVGTLITDNLTDHFGVRLEVTTVVFAAALAATFALWYRGERTLSIHSIVTTKREGFYWLAILFTFALGTAAGDLIAERYDLGYWRAALLFGGAIAVIAVLHYQFKMDAVLSFWAAYILTRPLGASMGDFLSQPRTPGEDAGPRDVGLGLGTTGTTILFVAAIVGLVAYLMVTKRDVIEAESAAVMAD